MVIHPVVLCGGAGTRLWPLSTPERPKPLLRLVGDDTLLRATLDRVRGPAFADPLLVCARVHAHAIAAEAPEAQLFVEDEPRGTAAAVVAACRQRPGELVLVLPADHVIRDVDGLHAAVWAGRVAADQGHLVMLGATPDRPETGYGWMKPGDELSGAPGVRRVERFLEKPDAARAAALLAEGGHLWNMGIFLLRSDALLDEHARLAGPDERGSLDVLVMERTDRAAVVPVSLGWDDVGTWAAVARLGPAAGGPVRLVEPGARQQVRGTLVHGRLAREDGAVVGPFEEVDGELEALEPSLVVTSGAG
jgi:mannose-1-phosphate guanylyltransferase